MAKYTLIYLFLVFSIFAISSCDNLEKIQKSKDFSYKLVKANEFFDKKKYVSASVLYEELLTVYKGTKSFEDIYYKFAYCFYNTKDYLQASYHFKNFVDIFPASPRAEECLFMHCKALYQDSPTPDLDQTNTIKSMTVIQTFLNTYPDSKYTDECNTLMDESYKKLEQKEELNADLYYKISEFKSAHVAYKELIKKYPDSKKADYYQLMVLKSYYNFARSSILSKQVERYNQVLSDYADFKTNFPRSGLAKEAEAIEKTVKLELAKAEEQIKKQQ